MCVCVCESVLNCVQLFTTSWTVAHQAPLSMEFSRQEYWSGLPSPSPGALSDSRIKPSSSALQVDSLLSEPPRKLSGKMFIISKSLLPSLEQSETGNKIQRLLIIKKAY